MTDVIRVTDIGLARWFSPEHAGEKFTDIALGLCRLLADMRQGKTRGIQRRLQAIHAMADKYARYYVSECPIQSVRVVHPTGAVVVRLATGEEVLIPRGAAREEQLVDESGSPYQRPSRSPRTSSSCEAQAWRRTRRSSGRK